MYIECIYKYIFKYVVKSILISACKNSWLFWTSSSHVKTCHVPQTYMFVQYLPIKLSWLLSLAITFITSDFWEKPEIENVLKLPTSKVYQTKKLTQLTRSIFEDFREWEHFRECARWSSKRMDSKAPVEMLDIPISTEVLEKRKKNINIIKYLHVYYVDICFFHQLV